MELYKGQDLLELNEVELYGTRVWYQQVFVEEIGGELDQRLLQDAPLSVITNTNPEGDDNATTIPSILSLKVTLLISILYSPLPQQITQELLQNLLTNNIWKFLQLLQVSNSPVTPPYFETI